MVQLIKIQHDTLFNINLSALLAYPLIIKLAEEINCEG